MIDDSMLTLDEWVAGDSTPQNKDKTRSWWHPSETLPKDKAGPNWAAVYSQDSWMKVLREVKETVENEGEVILKQHIKNFRDTYKTADLIMKEGHPLRGTLTELERTFCRICLIYNQLVPGNNLRENQPTYIEIEQNINHARKYEREEEEVPSEDGEEPSPQLADDINLHPLMKDLTQYINAPHAPKWAQEAQRLDEGEDAEPIIHIRRYIIDLANNAMVPANNKHLKLLIADTDIKLILDQTTSWWLNKIEGYGGNAYAVAIGRALKELAQGPQTPQSTVRNTFPFRGVQVNPPQTPFNIFQSPQLNRTTFSMNNQTPLDGFRQQYPTTATQSFGMDQSAQRTHMPTPSRHNNFGHFETHTFAPSSDTQTEEPTMEAILRSLAKIQINQSQQTKASHTPKLPQLEVPKYDGNQLQFLRWWDRYNAAIHSNPSLTDQQKFLYLQQYLTNEAQKFCWGASTDTLLYKDAVDKVFEKYCVSNRLTDAYQQQIIDCAMPHGINDTVGMRNLIDTTQQSLSCLARFGISPQQISMPTMREFRRRMPETLLNALAHTFKCKISDLNLSEFLMVMDEYAKPLEETMHHKRLCSKTNLSPSESGAIPKTTMSTQGRGPPAPAPRGPVPRACIFCNENKHSMRNCPWKTDPAERFRIFIGLKRCTSCASDKHSWKECNSPKYCKVRIPTEQECKERHHNSLHEYFLNKRAGQYNRGPPRRQENANNQPPRRTQESNRGQNRTATATTTQTVQESDTAENSGTESTSIATTVTSSISKAKNTVILGILQSQASSTQKPKQGTQANIFIDEGSDTSFITENMAKTLNLPIVGKVSQSVNVFGATTISREYPSTQVRLSSRRGGQAIIDVLVTPEITKPFITTEWKEAAKDFPTWSFPQLRESPFQVDILIGMDHIMDIKKKTFKVADKLEVRQTILGPYLAGRKPISQTHNEEQPLKANMVQVESPLEAKLNDLVFAKEDFNESEDNEPTKHELLKRLHDGTKRVKTETGETLYQVPMLWRSSDAKMRLKPNFSQCKAFLDKQFEKMEKEGTLAECDKLIKTAIDNGFYEITETRENEGHHIPHFFVKNENSTSTPIRHVITGNLGKPAINDVLETGPSLINDLPTLTRQFRSSKVGITGDLSKAFNHLVIDPNDRMYFKILWYMNGDKNKLVTLQMARVPFGTNLAPFQLFGTLMYHLNGHDHPEAKGLIERLYSDNLVTSVKGDELKYTLDAVNIFSSGGFKLCKFSTSSAVLAQELENRDLLNTKETQETRVLGMRWKMSEDTLGWYKPRKPIDNNGVVTRRSMLQWTPRHFDPLGILEGVVMPARAFQFRDEIYENYQWDEPLSEKHKGEFLALANEITRCIELTIPRHHDFDPGRNIGLHVFSDASVSWGGCCAYLTQDGKSTLVASKAKKPSKRLQANLTIPKRELEAMVLGAKMLNTLRNTYKNIYPHIEPHLWSDSQIVLHWQTNQKKIGAFVDNRVRLINDLIKQTPLHYVDTGENPSDPVSRGMTAEEFLNKNSLFWTGPPVMHEDQIPCFKPEKEEDTLVAITLATSIVTESNKPSILNLVGESNTLKNMKVKLASVMKCARKWQKKPPLEGAKLAKTVATAIMKAEQEVTIPVIINYLKGNLPKYPRPQEIHPNQLFLDSEGIVRCGGRLGNSSMSYSSRFPIYYPNNSPLIKQRALEMHEYAKHAGPAVTRAKILQTLWIPRSSNVVRQILKSCYKCKLQSGQPFRWPKSPNLPTERVTVEPYNTIGCDLTGSFTVRSKEGFQKIYIAIFTDCGTRHMSVQVMDNMETGTFLQAFRRHCSIYGTPTKVISDQGTYFIKSDAVLGEKLGEEWCNDIGEAMNRKGISWQFNPAGAPHFGGHYERLIGTLKGPLKRCIGREVMDKQEFITLCKEAACVMNDRPLTTTNPSDLRDQATITPNLLVFGRHLSPMPYGEGNVEDPDDPMYEPNEEEVRRQWRRMATRLNLFKKQFAEEYMAYLRYRHKIQHHEDPVLPVPINVGDLVIMKSETEKRSLWDKAIVTEILPSSDGKTRAVRLRNMNGLCTRPIVKLVPLLTRPELQGESPDQTEDDAVRPETQEPDAAQVDQAAPPADAAAAQAPASTSRPQRASARRGREKVRKWTARLGD